MCSWEDCHVYRRAFIAECLSARQLIYMRVFGAMEYILEQDRDHQRRVREVSGAAQSVPYKNDTTECKH